MSNLKPLLLNDSGQFKWALFYRDEDALFFRGFGIEPEKISADSKLIQKINSIDRKIPVNVLLAVSSTEILPNGTATRNQNYNRKIAEKFEAHLKCKILFKLLFAKVGTKDGQM